ncbi:MAG: TonB-dependent receptor [Gammaproteobacteria bacterium]|nr:TonB-dependent receptor [Gammaproteobacteria bacterium]MCY4357024.1 TonB-dependent receptor [Gammaproteobacteria bacterium]
MNSKYLSVRGSDSVFTRKPLVSAIATATLAAGLIAPAPVLAQESTMVIEQIMVTARRRQESLQEVPVAVAVVDAEAIEQRGLQSIDDVARFAPGLSFSKAFGRATERPVVRGMGNVLAGVQFGVESGAAYFIDGVYYPGDLQGLNLNDLERVEVIKGPQSALYGRNSYAGAINFTTKSPTDEFSSDIRTLFAQDGERDIRASISGPIIPGVLGGSVSLRSYDFDGQWTNTVTQQTIGNESTDSISGMLEWTPNEQLRVRVRGMAQEDDDGTRALFLQNSTENNCFPGLRSLSSWPLSGSSNQNQYFCGDVQPGTIALNDEDSVGDTILVPGVPVRATFFGNPYDRTDGTAFDGVLREINLGSLLLEYELDNGYALTLSSAYRHEDLSTGSDSDHSSVNFKFRGNPPAEEGLFANTAQAEREDYSVEVRFDSPQDEAFRWMVGAFYFNQDTEGSDITFTGPNILENNQTLENLAVFGSLTYDFSDRLTGSAEIRYMEETKKLDEVNPMGVNTFSGNDTWDSTSPRLTLNYQWSDDVMLYGTFATGVKPGGFNGASGTRVMAETYKQEEATNVEFGIKSTLMDGRVMANAALFFNDVTDVQLTTPVEVPGTQNLTSIVTNQGAGEIFGVELDLTYYVSENLLVGANYALADTEFTEGCDEFQWTLTSGGGRWRGDASSSLNPNGRGDCSIVGNQFPLSSENQFSTYINYTASISNGLEFFFNADFTYESEKPTQVHNLAFAPQARVVGTRFGLNGENWTLAAIGRNLTNEDAPPMITRWLQTPIFSFASVNTAIPSARTGNPGIPGADTGSPRAFFGALRRERQYGVEFIYRF